MTHLQIIQSLEEYKRQRINLPLPHAVKLIIENYVILGDVIKYMQFYIIDGKTGSYVDSIVNNIKILINGIEQEYVVNDNLYTLFYITNQDYNFTNTFEITILSDNYKQTILATTPNRVNNTRIPLFEQSNDDEIYINWDHTHDEYTSGYDIDTHVVIYGPKNGSDTEYERKGEVAYAHKYFMDDNISVVLDIDDTGSANGETITVQHITDLAKEYIIYYVQYDWSNYNYNNSTVFTKRNASVLFRSANSDDEFVEILPPENITSGRYWKVLAVKNHEIYESLNAIENNSELLSPWHIFMDLNSETDSIYESGYTAGQNDYTNNVQSENPYSEQDNPNSYYSWKCGYTHGNIMAEAGQLDYDYLAELGYNSEHYDLSVCGIEETHPMYKTYMDAYTSGWINKLQNIVETNNITNDTHRGDTTPEEVGLISSDYTNIRIYSLNYTIDNIWTILYDIEWYNKIVEMVSDAVQSDENMNDTTPEDVGLNETDYINVIYGWGENINEPVLIRENAWEYEYNDQWNRKISNLPQRLPGVNTGNKNWLDTLITVEKKLEFEKIEKQ